MGWSLIPLFSSVGTLSHVLKHWYLNKNLNKISYVVFTQEAIFLTMQSSKHIPNIKEFLNFKSLSLTFFRYEKDVNASEGRSPPVPTHGTTQSHYTEVHQCLTMVPPKPLHQSPPVPTHGTIQSHYTKVHQCLPMVPPMAMAPDI